MAERVVRPLMRGLVAIFGVSAVVFLATHILPGDPISVLLGPAASLADVESMRDHLGLNQPLLVQYVIFLRNALHGDMGRSIYYAQPALPLVLSRLPATMELALCATVLSVVISMPLGIVWAVRLDQGLGGAVVAALVSLTQSMASFWVGIILILIFSLRLGLFPTSGYGQPSHLVLPTVALALPHIALLSGMMRTQTLEALRQDYVTVAYSKGLSKADVIRRHVTKNCLIPFVTVVGLQFGRLLGGAVVTETVFAWPGVGTLAVNAIINRDYPLIQAAVFVVAVAFVLANSAVDILYRFLDPRVRV